MVRNKKHIESQEAFQRYLDDRMSPEERHEFEKNMPEDSFESEALEGAEQLEKGDFSKDMLNLHSQLAAKTRENSRGLYWRIAATLLLLAVFSFTIFYFIDINAPQNTVRNEEPPDAKVSMQEHSETVEKATDTESEKDEIIAYQEEKEVPKPAEISEKKKEIVPDPPSIAEVLTDSEEAADSELDFELSDELFEEEITAVVEQKEMIAIPSTAKSKPEEAASESAGRKKETSSLSSRNAAITGGMKTITGKVMSETDAEALPGVNVIIKGTAKGTVTDIEGNYTIDVPIGEKPVLVYSSVGYISEEVTVGEKKEIDVNIEPDVTALSEIVVTGYASKRNSDLSGAVSEFEENSYRFIPPMPVGGQKKFKEYIEDNIRYPVSGLEESLKGTVKLKFTVEKTGEIANVEILKSLGEAFDAEAVRLINEGPDWEPALVNDSISERDVTVKIRFRPPEK